LCQKYAEEKSTVLEKEVRLYTVLQSAKLIPENLKDGIFHGRKFEG